MARSPFSIFKRIDKNGKAYYSVRFFNSDGSIIKTKTLREAKSPTQAARMAEGLLKAGVISNEQNPDVLTYFLGFWTRESDYVQGRALRGLVLSEKYLYGNRQAINSLLKSYLKNKKLLDLTPDYLERIILSLHKKGYSPRRINVALQALRVPYGYFCKLHRIVNQLSVIEAVKERPRERGILNAEEVGRIIALDHESPRIKASILLGALCGLRLGEVRGLQRDDIDYEKGTIYIRHNFVDNREGLKAPKWNSTREVSLPGPVADALRTVQAIAPEGSTYAIFNEKTHARPITESTIRAGFHRVLQAIGIDKRQQDERNLCFHGLRHTFVSLSRAGGVPDFLVQRMAGHRSMAMTEQYSHSAGIVDFKAAREALEKAVGAVNE